MSEDRPLRVAVIGAGPAGFYAAGSLLKHPTRTVEVDIFDRLPVPYGLVRSGVAPDHANIKAVTRAFARTASKPGVRFFGHVELGRDITVDDLNAHYDQWVITVGCADDRRLGVVGEDLQGSHSAREFVAWYNGHPDFADASFDLSQKNVVIVGMGNVALDVARILLHDPEHLATTDIADHAVAALRASQVRTVTLVARRGPVAAACTPKELGELGGLHDVDVHVDADELELDVHTMPDEPHPNLLANLALFREYAERPSTGASRELRFRFYASPIALEGDDHVERLRMVRTELVQRGARWSAQATEQQIEIPADLVFRSIGYRGHQIVGLPFDASRGGIPNDAGRLLDAPGGRPMAKGYTAGWAKRGPSGVIGTNRSCAQDTVDRMIAETPDPTSPLPGPDAIVALLAERRVPVVTWEDWLRIDAHEVARGKAAGKPREKVVSREGFMMLLKNV